MAGGGPIRSVIVAGGGMVAWGCAAALRRKLPAIEVTVIPLAVAAGALADRIASTLPSVLDFHQDIGLEDSDPVLRAGCGFRAGTLFEGWLDGRDDYAHVYDRYGQQFGTTSFHNHWVRAAKKGGAAPFDAYAPAAAMARAGRFLLPEHRPAGSPLSEFGFGLALDVDHYTAMLRAYARHIGARERPAAITGVQLRAEDGFIAGLTLDDGSMITADLFVDCTGPAALLRSELDQSFEDWGQWLACDRVLMADAAATEGQPLDHAIAHAAGWRWTATNPARTSHGLVYASTHLTDARAARTLRGFAGIEPGAPIALRQGRRPQPWLRNCVAIGDAAITLEPLEWTNLHLAHNFIDRLVAMLPDRDCAAVELWDFNRQCAAETDRVRDFMVLHYVASRRADPFWRDLRAVAPPASLAHTMSLFGDRGRLPFYEDETFSRDSWLAVLIGQGVIPRRTDPLIDSVPPEQSDRAMAAMRESLAAIVSTLPIYSTFLRTLKGQSAP
ncbi:MAG: tryptophan halogenase family protein [Sphingomonas sp.]